MGKFRKEFELEIISIYDYHRHNEGNVYKPIRKDYNMLSLAKPFIDKLKEENFTEKEMIILFTECLRILRG